MTESQRINTESQRKLIEPETALHLLSRAIDTAFGTNSEFVKIPVTVAIKIENTLIQMRHSLQTEEHEKVSHEKCPYFHVEYGQGVCWGTKEKDPCHHNGDRSVCGLA